MKGSDLIDFFTIPKRFGFAVSTSWLGGSLTFEQDLNFPAEFIITQYPAAVSDLSYLLEFRTWNRYIGGIFVLTAASFPIVTKPAIQFVNADKRVCRTKGIGMEA